jgi:tetratricopeptide (TPR) repeat protein
MNALGLQTPASDVKQQTPNAPSSLLTDSAILLEQRETVPSAVVQEPQSSFDLTQAAADAQRLVSNSANAEVDSSSVANQDIAWYNQGVGLISDGKFREALSCFDRALPSFTGNEEMLIRILNGRGNAFYFMEEYPKCVESYHQAMLIRPAKPSTIWAVHMPKWSGIRMQSNALSSRFHAASAQKKSSEPRNKYDGVEYSKRKLFAKTSADKFYR